MIHGSNLMLLNVTYIRPDKRRKIEESFEVIYKDIDSNTVRMSYEPAEVDIYFTKPEFRDHNYNKPQERIEKLDKVTCLYSEIKFEIAKQIGQTGLDFVKQCFENRDYRALDKLYAWPYCYKCDFQPEYYFIAKWHEQYSLSASAKPSKSYLDIETDLIDFNVEMNDVAHSANAPVNLVSIFLQDSMDMYTFVLEPYAPKRYNYTDEEWEVRQKLYQRQLSAHRELVENKKKFIDGLKKEFNPMYGDIDYHIRIYKEEVELIADVFRLVNDRKPNFMLVWNMRFDIPYLVHRIETLGYDPKEVFTNPDFKVQKCYFREDKRTFQMEKQFDYFYVSSYTQFICQMRLYGSIRKSQHKLRSLSLNAIGDRELKDRKVDYPPNTNMRMFPYEDWLLFIKYNIKDVLIQFGIERKTNDVMTYFKRSYSNQTPYSKIFRETHLLRNVREMYFEKDGWIQGNNINIIGQDEEDIFDQFESDDEDENEVIERAMSFKGAIVADPAYNDSIGEEILGTESNTIYKNSMDADMGAFYPSIKIASNMDPSTLEFKAYIDTNKYIKGTYPNRSLNITYIDKDKFGNERLNDITGECINTYMSGNILTFGNNWLNLPDMYDLYNELKSNQ